MPLTLESIYSIWITLPWYNNVLILNCKHCTWYSFFITYLHESAQLQLCGCFALLRHHSPVYLLNNKRWLSPHFCEVSLRYVVQKPAGSHLVRLWKEQRDTNKWVNSRRSGTREAAITELLTLPWSKVAASYNIGIREMLAPVYTESTPRIVVGWLLL